jgi:hypothetical protein
LSLLRGLQKAASSLFYSRPAFRPNKARNGNVLSGIAG